MPISEKAAWLLRGQADLAPLPHGTAAFDANELSRVASANVYPRAGRDAVDLNAVTRISTAAARFALALAR
jgi:hypothetical protein